MYVLIVVGKQIVKYFFIIFEILLMEILRH